MDSNIAGERAGSTREPTNWAQGDGGLILKYQQHGADAFVAGIDLQPGARVLDVACGVGNAAVAAARAGARATGLDIAPSAIKQAQVRARAEGLAIHYDVGDFEAMPYDDGSFDVVLSMFGVMFALHPERAAAELARVCRSGGLIVLANWPPDSLIANLFRTATRYVPPPPGSPPFLWGEEEPVRQWLGPFVTKLELQRQPYPMRFPFAPRRAAEDISQSVGPVRQALTALAEGRRADLQADIEQLFVLHNRATDGSTEIRTEYLEARGWRK